MQLIGAPKCDRTGRSRPGFVNEGHASARVVVLREMRGPRIGAILLTNSNALCDEGRVNEENYGRRRKSKKIRIGHGTRCT
jgi:hypothetical protein